MSFRLESYSPLPTSTLGVFALPRSDVDSCCSWLVNLSHAPYAMESPSPPPDEAATGVVHAL